MKTKIVVAGLGLIGGSLAMAIRQNEQHYLIGYDTNEEVLDYAKKEGIVHEAYTDLDEAAKEADYVFLAAPISASIQMLRQLNEMIFDHEVIVSDVSSVKGTIFEEANALTNEQLCFIGGHPMAGSHKAGIRAAKAHLFENAIYVLTPTNQCNNGQVEKVQEVLQGARSHFLILNPEEHDEMTSVISHFPHLIASSLVHQAKKWEQVHQYLPELAAGGFRDITRIASSNPKMWQDIFAHNGTKMSRLLQEWINEMVTLKEFLDKDNQAEMVTYLEEAKDYRDGLNVSKRGALPSFYDVYVDVKDQPGAIATVVQLLASKKISLRNIRILEIRDNVMGALRLTVTSKEDQEAATAVLQANAYDVSVAE